MGYIAETPHIKISPKRVLIGLKKEMTFKKIETPFLWRSFMPRTGEIQNRIGSDLYSLQIYLKNVDFARLTIDTPFEKWAAIEVKSLNSIPQQMKSLILEEGLFAVFQYRGRASEAEGAFRYIFESWLPSSDFVIDQRPHFEILGHNYRVDDPNSEEEIWIPIRKREVS